MEESLYNVGSGEEITIKELAELIQEIIGHKGNIVWDKTKPDGTPRKLMNSSLLIKKGWSIEIELKFGIAMTKKVFI